MGGEELPPAKSPYPKARPCYRRPGCVIGLLLLGTTSFFIIHPISEGEITTAASTVGAEAAELKEEQEEERREAAADHEAAAAAASQIVADKAYIAPAVVASPPPPSVPDIAELQLKVPGSDEVLKLRLKLTPEHSESSVAFVKQAAEAGCLGELYRSERNFLIQGRIECKPGQATTTVVKGGCPAGVKVDDSRKCPSHDPQCGCHGPIMSHGMVGWAGGGAGPDFFIYIGSGAASHWAHDHTVFAEVADPPSWQTIEKLGKLPVKTGGMTFFKDKIPLALAKPS